MFWNRKKQSDSALTREEMHQDVRDHHYVFAHIALREACESDPGQFFNLMLSDDAEGLVSHLWEQVCDSLGGVPKDMDMSTLAIVPCEVLESRAVLIVMPQARRIAEAVMLLIVEKDGIQGMDAASLPFRFFTLELGEDEDEQVCGVYSEWAGSTHLNYGGGPMPDIAGFRAWVAHFLSQ